MAYTFLQLEAFYWVARLGSFRAAARQLNLTQPAVSLRVRELERALDTRLFDRSGYRPRLTHRAADILRHTERLLSLADEIGEKGRAEEPLRSLLRIGAADSFALICLPQLLRHLEHQYPALKVEVTVAFSQQLNELLARRELDVAFLSQPHISGAVTGQPLGNFELAWVASPRYAFPNRPLRPADLADAQIITNPAPSHLYGSVETWFASAGLKPTRVSTCNSLSIIIRLTSSEFGVSLLPVSILTEEIGSGLLRSLRCKPRIAPHTMYVAYQADEAGPGIDAVILASREILDRSKMLAPF